MYVAGKGRGQVQLRQHGHDLSYKYLAKYSWDYKSKRKFARKLYNVGFASLRVRLIRLSWKESMVTTAYTCSKISAYTIRGLFDHMIIVSRLLYANQAQNHLQLDTFRQQLGLYHYEKHVLWQDQGLCMIILSLPGSLLESRVIILYRKIHRR